MPKNEKARIRREAGPRQVRVDAPTRALAQSAWQRLSAGSGFNGEGHYDWAAITLWRHGAEPGMDRLPLRRSIADPEGRAHKLVHAPGMEAVEAVVRVADRRWAVEVAFARQPLPLSWS